MGLNAFVLACLEHGLESSLCNLNSSWLNKLKIRAGYGVTGIKILKLCLSNTFITLKYLMEWLLIAQVDAEVHLELHGKSNDKRTLDLMLLCGTTALA